MKTTIPFSTRFRTRTREESGPRDAVVIARLSLKDSGRLSAAILSAEGRRRPHIGTMVRMPFIKGGHLRTCKLCVLAILSLCLWAWPEARTQDKVKEEEPLIQSTIMSLEHGAMERWRQGDPWGWMEISDKDIIYTDPGLVKPIVGIEAYRGYLKQFEDKIHYQVSEFIDPRVKRYGDLAVLTYNYRDAQIDEDGSVREQWLWSTTEVYVLKNGEWRILHTHWSFIKQRLPEQAEIPVLVKPDKAGYEGVLGELMALESSAMERWRQGDPRGFAGLSSQEITYFDTGTPKRIDGLEALRTEYAKRAGRNRYDVMEFIDPQIRVVGDAAVLFYRFFSTRLNPDGSIAGRIPWNCTEVYAKIDQEWKIVHTHWSFINGMVGQ
jgi:ketosteroid isomerase-like protein